MVDHREKLHCFFAHFGLKKRFREPLILSLSQSRISILAPVVFILEETKQENILKNCHVRGAVEVSMKRHLPPPPPLFSILFFTARSLSRHIR